jgi:hypothetical protein
MSIFARLAAGTGFRRFLDFVSPAFFEVMPPLQLAQQMRSLVAAYRDDAAFQKVRQEAASFLEDSNLGVRMLLDEDPPSRTDIRALPDEARSELGHALLRLYFAQLFSTRPTLLDLSRDRFGVLDGTLVWTPGKGHLAWDESFRGAMVAIYQGFYHEVPGALAQALDRLHLASAEPLFRQHFGEGAQKSVRFTVAHFVDSFHQIFVHCKEAKIRLHPNFLPLGIYLATLYESLEALDVPLDVRTAFLQVDTWT